MTTVNKLKIIEERKKKTHYKRKEWWKLKTK